MSAPFAEVRYGPGPWQIVDRRGFQEWVANMRHRGCGAARPLPSLSAGTDETENT